MLPPFIKRIIVTKKIQFVTTEQEIQDKIDIPKPARQYVADWYKRANNFIGGNMEIKEYGINKDIKLCAPFLDIMTAGYTVELLCDLLVEKTGDTIKFNWSETPAPIAMRDKKMASTLPRPAGHSNNMYAWVMPYGPLTPPGYSALITHPFNRFDLPFTCTSGIIESDNYSMPGEIPFFFKEDFEGIIPAGTPIIQILPFKRDSWKSEKKKFDNSFNLKQLFSIRKSIYGAYKKLYWIKKEFN